MDEMAIELIIDYTRRIIIKYWIHNYRKWADLFLIVSYTLISSECKIHFYF